LSIDEDVDQPAKLTDDVVSREMRVVGTALVALSVGTTPAALPPPLGSDAGSHLPQLYGLRDGVVGHLPASPSHTGEEVRVKHSRKKRTAPVLVTCNFPHLLAGAANRAAPG
jgi:hypothetical protein